MDSELLSVSQSPAGIATAIADGVRGVYTGPGKRAITLSDVSITAASTSTPSLPSSMSSSFAALSNSRRIQVNTNINNSGNSNTGGTTGAAGGASANPSASHGVNSNQPPKNTPTLADRVAVLLASPLTSTASAPHRDGASPSGAGGGSSGGGAGARRASRIARASTHECATATRVADALDKLARATAAASALHPLHAAVPVRSNPNEAMIPLVVRSLRDHQRQPRVATSALNALTYLAASAPYRARIGAESGIQAVVEAMRVHSLRANIQAQACLLLANLTYRTPANKTIALQCGAVIVVVAAMAVHPTVEQVQAWACLALRNFTKIAPHECPHPHVVSSAVEVLVAALEAFPSSRTVQTQGCIALGNMAAISDVAQTRISALGASNAVVQSLCRGVSSASLADAALTCLRVLATTSRGQQLLLRDGAGCALAAAMHRHPLRAVLLAKACAALRQLATTPHGRLHLGVAGVVEQVTAAIGTHCARARPRELREMLHALANAVTDSPQNQELARRADALSIVVKVLGIYTPRDTRGESGAEALRVLDDASRLLHELIAHSHSNQNAAVDARAPSQMLDTLRERGPFTPGVAEYGTAVFVVLADNLSLDVDVQRGSSDLASIMRRLRHTFPRNERVGYQVAALLAALGLRDEEVDVAWPSGLGDPWAEDLFQKRDLLTRASSALRCRGSACLD